MAQLHLLVLLIGTFIVAGIAAAVYYINRMFNNIFNLIYDIKQNVKDARIEVKKLKDSRKD